jgi:aldehyde dehydrogenase (NAD+)
MTSDYRKFYIDGAFVDPAEARPLGVVDPSTERVFATISLGTQTDVDRAVAAARFAFDGFSQTTREERLAILERILEIYRRRYEDMAQAISHEMGSPIARARDSQAYAGQGHLEALIEAFKDFAFDEQRGSTVVTHEPVGVVALITPWNWPMNQIMCKVAPALAAGCTMVLKPSEIAPISGMVFAEILHEAGVPKGVFNLVNGTGPEVGAALSSHPDVDMVSFTGSTRAGTDVARRAARDGQARLAGTRRQVRQYHPARSRSRKRCQPGRARLFRQYRPVLRRADPHAGAGRQARGGTRHRPRNRARGGRRRSAR